jgi:hypothetical protein
MIPGIIEEDKEKEKGPPSAQPVASVQTPV